LTRDSHEPGSNSSAVFPASAEQHVLLCTDLHAGNVLAAEREPWLVVEPKPFVGDRSTILSSTSTNEDRLLAAPKDFPPTHR